MFPIPKVYVGLATTSNDIPVNNPVEEYEDKCGIITEPFQLVNDTMTKCYYCFDDVDKDQCCFIRDGKNTKFPFPFCRPECAKAHCYTMENYSYILSLFLEDYGLQIIRAPCISLLYTKSIQEFKKMSGTVIHTTKLSFHQTNPNPKTFCFYCRRSNLKELYFVPFNRLEDIPFPFCTLSCGKAYIKQGSNYTKGMELFAEKFGIGIIQAPSRGILYHKDINFSLDKFHNYIKDKMIVLSRTDDPIVMPLWYDYISEEDITSEHKQIHFRRNVVKVNEYSQVVDFKEASIDKSETKVAPIIKTISFDNHIQISNESNMQDSFLKTIDMETK